MFEDCDSNFGKYSVLASVVQINHLSASIHNLIPHVRLNDALRNKQGKLILCMEELFGT